LLATHKRTRLNGKPQQRLNCPNVSTALPVEITKVLVLKLKPPDSAPYDGQMDTMMPICRRRVTLLHYAPQKEWRGERGSTEDHGGDSTGVTTRGT
jgi:hypothetical protein